MKLPKTVHKNLFVVLVASLLLLGGLSAALKPSVKTWGEAVSGLQMTIYLDRAEGVPSKAPKFRIELRNAAEKDLVVNLGMMLANGKMQYPNALVLILTDAQRKSRRLDLRFAAAALQPAGNRHTAVQRRIRHHCYVGKERRAGKPDGGFPISS